MLSAIAVIFVTSTHRPEGETRPLAAGAAGFISKPFNPAVARARAQLTLKRQADLLREMVLIDRLTGVRNRRHIDDRLSTEVQRARRTGAKLALLMADVNYFNHYNDCYGHAACAVWPMC